MINLHDWREMPEVEQLRQGDTYTHVWENKSLLRKRITNTTVQGNCIVQRGLVAQPHLLTNSIQEGNSSAWDCGLDVSPVPDWGTEPSQAEQNLEIKGNRKRMRRNKQEDIALTEVSSISFYHQRNRKVKQEKITINATVKGRRSWRERSHYQSTNIWLFHCCEQNVNKQGIIYKRGCATHGVHSCTTSITSE